MTSINTEFDFDELARLAKDDPEAFESRRELMIREVIDSTSPEVKRRMEGLQWQIDQIRSASANPMSSCLKISQMMWDKAVGEHGLVDHMRQLSNPVNPTEFDKPKESATVINIRNDVQNSDKS
jgi:uncharacterized protein DUF3135